MPNRPAGAGASWHGHQMNHRLGGASAASRIWRKARDGRIAERLVLVEDILFARSVPGYVSDSWNTVHPQAGRHSLGYSVACLILHIM